MQAEIARELATRHVDVANARTYHSDFPRARQSAQEGARLDPTNPTAWNNAAYAMLLLEDFVGADSTLRRSYAIGPTLTNLLNLATVARYRGRPDSALTWLRRAEEWAAPARSPELERYGQWVVAHLPLRPGDRETVRRTARIRTSEEKLSLIHFGTALAQAQRGDYRAADLALERALALAPRSDELRCWVAGLVHSAQGFGRLRRAADGWVRSALATLGCRG